MAIIDFGGLRDDPDPYDGPSRSRVRAFRRPLWMAAAPLLVLTVLAADASGPVRIVAVVPGGLGARVFLAGDLFLVAAPVPGGLRALDPATGDVRWCPGLTLVCQRTDGASFGVWRWSE
ncbi:hypothetical protein [Micromonospora avicenniae]|uniref:hypothetical protein n=1 Tax=Micromonospora avicenniae TaxID=1198245 RepID=UPI003326CF6B